MGWTSGIVVYVILWWMVFFMALPIGVKPPHEVGEEDKPGHAVGAPVNPRLWTKVGAATVVAGLLWILAYWLIASNYLSFRQ